MKKIKKLMFSLSTMLIVSSFSGCTLKRDLSSPSDVKNLNSYATKIKIESDDCVNIEDNIISVIEQGDNDVFVDERIASPSLLSPTISEQENIIVENADTRKLVALTFDDGPSKYTDVLLEVLNDNDVKATFFVLGCNCDNYTDTLLKISDSGHEIAIHGDTHTAFTKLSVEQVNNEITTTINYIESLGIDVSGLVRPPYGNLNSELKEQIEYPFILWNIDTEDWKTKDKEQIKAEILENIAAGSIILMHDTKAVHEVDIEVLKEILPELTQEYKFVTISELCEYYNIELENGKTYRKITGN